MVGRHLLILSNLLGLVSSIFQKEEGRVQMCVCILCDCVCRCLLPAGMHVHVCTHMWRPDDNLRLLSTVSETGSLAYLYLTK